jgi:prepilin-type N-terminal cleavage/methylation domain-containing protein
MKVSCRGFTLIEMAIVIMIIGLLVASLMPLYGLYQKQQEISNTEVNVTVAISAIGTFRSLHGRYPCPASLTQDRNDPLYGREDC